MTPDASIAASRLRRFDSAGGLLASLAERLAAALEPR
jgi:hypothetical protein